MAFTKSLPGAQHSKLIAPGQSTYFFIGQQRKRLHHWFAFCCFFVPLLLHKNYSTKSWHHLK